MKHTITITLLKANASLTDLRDVIDSIPAITMTQDLVRGNVVICITKYRDCSLSDVELGLIIGNYINRRDIL